MQDNEEKFYYDYSICEIPFDINPYYQKGHTVKWCTEKDIQINTKKQIEKDDKTNISSFFVPEEHNILTLELIDKSFIKKEDIQIFYYDNLFEQLIDDGNSYKDLVKIIHYIITRVIKRNSKDEDGNEIENKFGYFKNAIISNINKLNTNAEDL